MAEVKISDEAFFAILRENAGLYARTAAAISNQFGIDYSRQAVRQRALEHKEVLEDIEDEIIDTIEDGLLTLAKDQDPKIKLDAIKFYLKTKGKKRGYSERTEITGANGGALQTESKHVVEFHDFSNQPEVQP